MVNPGEVLIKAVMFDRPKMLTGLNQKVRGQAQRLQRSSVADDAPPAERHDLTPGDQPGERSNPVVLPARGKRTVRRADGTAGKG